MEADHLAPALMGKDKARLGGGQLIGPVRRRRPFKQRHITADGDVAGFHKARDAGMIGGAGAKPFFGNFNNAFVNKYDIQAVKPIFPF